MGTCYCNVSHCNSPRRWRRRGRIPYRMRNSVRLITARVTRSSRPASTHEKPPTAPNVVSTLKRLPTLFNIARDLHARGPPHPIAPDLSLLRNRRRGSLRRTYPAAICLPQRSADWTDTVTMPCSAPEQNSAPLPRFTSESSGPPSDSPDNEGSRSICTCSPRRTSLLPRSGPSFPRRFPDAHAPARVSRNLLTALDAA
jgi:hypothetical protein